MAFPFGEWILVILTIVTGVEKKPFRYFFYVLSLAWITGKVFENFLPIYSHHWALSRLAALLIVLIWSWHKANKHWLPLAFATLAFVIEDLFLLNEPGIFQYENWFFAGTVLLVLWLMTEDFWELAFAAAGGIIINQAFKLYLFDGIVLHVDLPNSFTWNFWVVALAAVRLISLQHQKRKQGAVDEIREEEVSTLELRAD